MKKKLLAGILCIAAIGIIGCGKKETNDEPQTIVEENTEEKNEAIDVADATQLLTDVWATYEEAEMFPIGGGDFDNTVMDAPGKYDVTKVEDMDAVLGLPQNSAALIDDAASMMHMMNANTFTCGAYHVADAANVQTLADSLKDNIMNRQWMCGFPDTLIVVSVGEDYVVSAFGNAEIIETFKTKLQTQYEASEVLYEESLVE